MGAGVLPIALYKGALFMLLGQERNNNLWCDFGGSPHKGEKPFKTAIREGSEELNGFLGDENDFETTVTHNMILSITFDRYTSYIFKTNYDKNLPMYFTNVNNFAEFHLKDKIDTQHNGLFEKKRIQWFALSKFKEDKSRAMFREHYKPVIDSVLKNELFIIKYIETMNPNK
jgi:8-oxo-dGTP pyrophosphatase MutT (NUDIX family)